MSWRKLITEMHLSQTFIANRNEQSSVWGALSEDRNTDLNISVFGYLIKGV